MDMQDETQRVDEEDSPTSLEDPSAATDQAQSGGGEGQASKKKKRRKKKKKKKKAQSADATDGSTHNRTLVWLLSPTLRSPDHFIMRSCFKHTHTQYAIVTCTHF